MNGYRIQILIALVLLALSASTLSPSFASNRDPHVAASAPPESCFRLPVFTPAAGEWAWRSRRVCVYMPVFE